MFERLENLLNSIIGSGSPRNIGRRDALYILGLAALASCGKGNKGSGNGNGTIPAPNPTPADTTPPASIDIYAYQSTQAGEEVNLVWQSPGDDGLQGTPSFFMIKYSATPILTEDDWNNAKDLGTVNAVGPAGTNYNVMLPCEGGDWFYALKTFDEANNGSKVSKSPQGVSVHVPTKPEFYVDAQLPTTVFYLHGETWPLMNGEPANGIAGKALELGTILATVTAPPYDTPAAMEAYLLSVTDGVYDPVGSNNFELCENCSLVWNSLDFGQKVTLLTRTPGNPDCNPAAQDKYEGVSEENLLLFRKEVRKFLIAYTGEHPELFGNLDPTHDAGWSSAF